VKPASGRVLVVDDNEVNRDLLTRRVQRMGHTVSVAVDGRQALDLMEQEPFDLVLLDIMMPVMNGYEVLEYLKAEPTLCHIPVIVVSALDDLESVVKCIELGAEDYLTKPFNKVLLKARINNCLEKKMLRDQERFFLKQLQVEQERSQQLLLNILPKSIIELLKHDPSTIADNFEAVSVLFADIVGFTEISGNKSPTQLIEILNVIFSEFDNLTDRHGLEKIKTIGDAYMVVSGLPTPRADHAEAIAEMALDMLKEIEQFNKESGEAFSIRIGINSGPVIAGVIGLKKFSYDLWGDTVNLASRMESHGVADSIQITSNTYNLLKNKYLFEEKSNTPIKGKGNITTYLLKGRKFNLA
jgi:adenylate cyclase